MFLTCLITRAPMFAFLLSTFRTSVFVILFALFLNLCATSHLSTPPPLHSTRSLTSVSLLHRTSTLSTPSRLPVDSIGLLSTRMNFLRATLAFLLTITTALAFLLLGTASFLLLGAPPLQIAQIFLAPEFQQVLWATRIFASQ